MTDAILCTPHFREGKPVFAMRIEAVVTITHPDGRKEELSGGGDLCEEKHAKPFLPAIEYLRAINQPPVISGQIEPPEPKPSPQLPSPEVIQQKPGIFRCLVAECGAEVQYRTRGHHSSREHGKRAWEIPWLPLFDANGWLVCTCGYIIEGAGGMKQHENAAAEADKSGQVHLRKAEPYHWDASDLKTEVGRALARAVGK